MTKNYSFRWFAFAALLGLLTSGVSITFAQNRHPAYLRALTDLRSARAHLQGSDRAEIQKAEKEAINEIDQAMEEIRKASVDDGKGVKELPPVDMRLEPGTRLRHALDLLDKAGRDIAQDEDNKSAKELQERSYEHIRKAKHAVEEAIRAASHS
jgi:hypothetical protein